jgi:hypothetical protein
MAETDAVTFEFKEIVESLVKKQGIHEGLWGIYFEFGLNAGNGGPNATELRPITILSIQKIGIQRVPEPTNLSVDAAIVNPVQETEKKPASPKKRSKLAGME